VKRICAGFALALVAGLALLGTVPVPAESPPPASVRIGLVQTLFNKTPDAIVQMAMKPFKAYLEAQTGIAGQVVTGGDAFTLSRQLKENDLQLAVLHGIEFAWARQRYPSLRPLIIAVNHYPTLRALLVVRTECKATNYTHLQGKVMAVPIQNKEHCRLFFERRCVKPGVKPGKFYSELTAPADAGDALADVLEGNADATVVDRTALEAYRKDHPAKGGKLKVIQESEAFPCGVVAYDSARLNEATVRLYRATLLSAKDSSSGQKMLQLIRLTGFEAVPEDFNSQLEEIVRAYPPPAPR
jgi:ABC-type phosphate/phosphonate transport system substrate-binding protein